MSEENQQFTIQKIYTKDISFESPKSPQVFSEGEMQPQIKVQLQHGYQEISDGKYEVTLSATVTATINESTAFLVEVKQAGLFHIIGFTDESLGGMLGAYCPETLFPFLREAISDLTLKGGFPQLLISPVNFNALHTEQINKQAESSAQESAEQ